MEAPTVEREKLEQRLRELKLEFEQGQAALAEIDRQRQELRDGLLSLAGAIRVLSEFVGAPHDGSLHPQAGATHNDAPTRSKPDQGTLG